MGKYMLRSYWAEHSNVAMGMDLTSKFSFMPRLPLEKDAHLVGRCSLARCPHVVWMQMVMEGQLSNWRLRVQPEVTSCRPARIGRTYGVQKYQ